MADRPDMTNAELERRIKAINSISADSIRKAQQSIVRAQASVSSAKSVDHSVSLINKSLNNLAKATETLSSGVQQMTLGSTKAITQYMKNMTDNIDKQSLTVMSLSKISPLFGAALTKMFDTPAFRDVFSNIGKGKQKIPHMASGGYVKKAGIAKLHPAEVVQPVDQIVDTIVKQVDKRLEIEGKKPAAKSISTSMNQMNMNALRFQKQLALQNTQLQKSLETTTFEIKAGTKAQREDANSAASHLAAIRKALAGEMTIMGNLDNQIIKAMERSPLFKAMYLSAKLATTPVKFLLKKRGGYEAELEQKGPPQELIASRLSSIYVRNTEGFKAVTGGLAYIAKLLGGAKTAEDFWAAGEKQQWTIPGALARTLIGKPTRWAARKLLPGRHKAVADMSMSEAVGYGGAAAYYKTKGIGWKAINAAKRRFSRKEEKLFQTISTRIGYVKNYTKVSAEQDKISNRGLKKLWKEQLKANKHLDRIKFRLRSTGKTLWSALLFIGGLLKSGITSLMSLPGTIMKMVTGGGGMASMLGMGAAGTGGLFGIKKLFGKVFGKKGAEKGIEKAAIKGAQKGLAKGLGKSLLKKLPLIGLATGIGFGISRLLKGDISGSIGEITSGALSMVPIIGTAASVGVDAALVAKDVNAAKKNAEQQTNLAKLKKEKAKYSSKYMTAEREAQIRQAQKAAQVAIPILGQATGPAGALAGVFTAQMLQKNPDAVVKAADNIIKLARDNEGAVDEYTLAAAKRISAAKEAILATKGVKGVWKEAGTWSTKTKDLLGVGAGVAAGKIQDAKAYAKKKLSFDTDSAMDWAKEKYADLIKEGKVKADDLRKAIQGMDRENAVAYIDGKLGPKSSLVTAASDRIKNTYKHITETPLDFAVSMFSKSKKEAMRRTDDVVDWFSHRYPTLVKEGKVKLGDVRRSVRDMSPEKAREFLDTRYGQYNKLVRETTKAGSETFGRMHATGAAALTKIKKEAKFTAEDVSKLSGKGAPKFGPPDTTKEEKRLQTLMNELAYYSYDNTYIFIVAELNDGQKIGHAQPARIGNVTEYQFAKYNGMNYMKKLIQTLQTAPDDDEKAKPLHIRILNQRPMTLDELRDKWPQWYKPVRDSIKKSIKERKKETDKVRKKIREIKADAPKPPAMTRLKNFFTGKDAWGRKKKDHVKEARNFGKKYLKMLENRKERDKKFMKEYQQRRKDAGVDNKKSLWSRLFKKNEESWRKDAFPKKKSKIPWWASIGPLAPAYGFGKLGFGLAKKAGMGILGFGQSMYSKAKEGVYAAGRKAKDLALSPFRWAGGKIKSGYETAKEGVYSAGRKAKDLALSPFRWAGGKIKSGAAKFGNMMENLPWYARYNPLLAGPRLTYGIGKKLLSKKEVPSGTAWRSSAALKEISKAGGTDWRNTALSSAVSKDSGTDWRSAALATSVKDSGTDWRETPKSAILKRDTVAQIQSAKESTNINMMKKLADKTEDVGKKLDKDKPPVVVTTANIDNSNNVSSNTTSNTNNQGTSSQDIQRRYPEVADLLTANLV